MGDYRIPSPTLGEEFGPHTPSTWRWRPQWLRRPRLQAPAWMSSLPFHLALLGLTVLSTVVVGVQVASNYTHGRPGFSLDLPSELFRQLWRHPSRLSLGVPFSAALLGILL